MKGKFELGQVVMTQGIAKLIDDDGCVSFDLCDCLDRHKLGDWGNLDEEDKQLNDYAIEHEGRLLSAYEVGEDKTKIWIITEWDRSATTILLPDEY